MVILSDDWVCIFVFVWMRHPATGATGGATGGEVLYSGGFLSVSSHYLILPRVTVKKAEH